MKTHKSKLEWQKNSKHKTMRKENYVEENCKDFKVNHLTN